jgi:hypothetical protein
MECVDVVGWKLIACLADENFLAVFYHHQPDDALVALFPAAAVNVDILFVIEAGSNVVFGTDVNAR